MSKKTREDVQNECLQIMLDMIEKPKTIINEQDTK